MDDLGVAAAVRAACVGAGEPDPLDEAETRRLAHDGLAGASLWTEDDGFALVREGDLVLAVAPSARRRGVGGRLAALAAGGADRAWSHGDHPAAARIAARLDWRRTRELWVMRRPASLPLPTLSVPAGVTIRGFVESDAPDVVAVNAAAFAHHPEQGGMDAADFAERRAEPWWDPAGLLVCRSADGELLGFHWTKLHDARHGEVYVVAVSPTAQGRGIGRLVTLAGLHHLAAAGVEEVLLYVESDNQPAVHVYAGLGFAHGDADTHVQWTASPGASDR